MDHNEPIPFAQNASGVHRLPRRSVLTGIAALVAYTRRGVGAVKANTPNGGLDYCYWQPDDYDRCLPDGTLQREWCFWCNDPGTGWTIVKCEWRNSGSC